MAVLDFQLHECRNVLHRFKHLDNVGVEYFDVLKHDELEQLQNGRFKKIVAIVVADEGIDDRCEELLLDNVPVVSVVPHRNDFAHKSQRREHQEAVRRPHQNQSSSQQILFPDAELSVRAVMFNAVQKQLQNQSQEMSRV